jgi:hypothetical protein
VAGDGSGADVEPIDGLGREFLRWAGLDGINPTWGKRISKSISQAEGWMVRNHTRNGKLSLSLQESGVRLDELLRLRTHRISIIPSAEVFSTPSRLLIRVQEIE